MDLELHDCRFITHLWGKEETFSRSWTVRRKGGRGGKTLSAGASDLKQASEQLQEMVACKVICEATRAHALGAAGKRFALLLVLQHIFGRSQVTNSQIVESGTSLSPPAGLVLFFYFSSTQVL